MGLFIIHVCCVLNNACLPSFQDSSNSLNPSLFCLLGLRYENQNVAIKIVHRGETPEEISKREGRFAREVSMLSRVKHKNLAKVCSNESSGVPRSDLASEDLYHILFVSNSSSVPAMSL